MVRYAQVVIGPAGSGKSTYCNEAFKFGEASNRVIHVVNLDPAAERFEYPAFADIRELIHLDDAMEDAELHLGPNGGLVFCMEYFSENMDWLNEQLGEVEDDYFVFDCPGQIELYTHLPAIKNFVEQLKSWGFLVCIVYLLDSQFLTDATKFASGLLTALSVMVNLETSQMNVMSKCDLLSKSQREEIDRYLEVTVKEILANDVRRGLINPKFDRFTNALADLVDDYSLVRFLPLDITDEESISDLILQIDNVVQYGEHLETKENKEMDLPEAPEEV